MVAIFALLLIIFGVIFVIKPGAVSHWWYQHMTFKILPENYTKFIVIVFGILIILMGISMLGSQLSN